MERIRNGFEKQAHLCVDKPSTNQKTIIKKKAWNRLRQGGLRKTSLCLEAWMFQQATKHNWL